MTVRAAGLPLSARQHNCYLSVVLTLRRCTSSQYGWHGPHTHAVCALGAHWGIYGTHRGLFLRCEGGKCVRQLGAKWQAEWMKEGRNEQFANFKFWGWWRFCYIAVGGGREMSEQKMQIIGYCQTISLSLLKMAGHTMYFLGKGRKVWWALSDLHILLQSSFWDGHLSSLSFSSL